MTRSSDGSTAGWLASLPAARRRAILRTLPPDELGQLAWHWPFWARPSQLAPAGDWDGWLILAGRGFGKTRAGAEWVRAQVTAGARRIALVGETAHDVRHVMVEGESGILAVCPPWERPAWEPSKRLLTWPGGAVAQAFSAEAPDQLRGPQHDAAWADEVAKWRDADAWVQLQLGLRLGVRPRWVATTTPRPVPLLRELLADPRVTVTRGSTFDNAGHLAPAFLNAVRRRYAGTRLGRQELDGELIDDVPGALWARRVLEGGRVTAAPPLTRVVVGVDPSVAADGGGSAAGIVVAGAAGADAFFVLADRSLRASPEGWARAAVVAFHAFEADRIVAETNQGGDLVAALIRTVDPAVPVRPVRARRGKAVRAEPVAALYEQGRVRHVGTFPELEDQMVNFTPTAAPMGSDRVDALVWAIGALAFANAGAPAVRRL